jgi:hypothetical protein
MASSRWRWKVRTDGPSRRISRRGSKPIDDGLREIVVVEHAARGPQGFVGPKDHQSATSMPVIDDVKEHVGRIGAIGEIARMAC